MSPNLSVSVRMYNVGFGDAFLVTVRKDQQLWTMLVDCGVHGQGMANPIQDVVETIIRDLAAHAPGAAPHLDVLVATHHHADHISGFASDSWTEVAVDEVWLPFVEDESDADAAAVRQTHALMAERLISYLDAALSENPDLRLDEGYETARSLATNSLRNADAADRLLGRAGSGFANRPNVKFLPPVRASDNIIQTKISEATVHVLGPPRDPEHLKRMNPPASARWLAMDDGVADVEGTGWTTKGPLFNSLFTMKEEESRLYVQPAGSGQPGEPYLWKAKRSLKLEQFSDMSEVLGAAGILERAVNNTSLFFVLDVGGVRLLFPGDAQQGAWDHVMADPAKLDLISTVSFYKISHHGSHNGTPVPYVEEYLDAGGYAMLPFGEVERWRGLIPKASLLEALSAKRTVIRADRPVAEDGKVAVHADGLWSEVTFTAP